MTLPWLCSYTTMGISGLIAYLICNGPEENTLSGRAKPLALAELAEEDEIFKDFAADKQLQQEVAQRLRSHGRHPDRCGLVVCVGTC